MAKMDIDIEIRPDGEVKIHLKGVKGKSCMTYVEFFEKMVGPVKSKQLTHEFYEPETPVHVRPELHIKEEL